MTTEQKDYTIGADPEFALSYGGELIYGDRFFNAVAGGDYDEDDPYVDRGEGEMNSLGLDGGDTVIEIRPMYAYKPIDLVSNIRQSMIKSISQNPHFGGMDWFGGPFVFDQPLGGHIHFGIHYRQWGMLNLTSALAFFACLVFSNFEDQNLALRRKSNYGSPTDAREQNWGMEYRSLSCWLESPITALAAISLCKHVVNQAMENPEKFNDMNKISRELTGDSLSMVLDAVQQHKVDKIKKYTKPIWTEMLSWPIHPDVDSGLKAVDAMLAIDFKMAQKVDLKANWGLGLSLEISS